MAKRHPTKDAVDGDCASVSKVFSRSTADFSKRITIPVPSGRPPSDTGVACNPESSRNFFPSSLSELPLLEVNTRPGMSSPGPALPFTPGRIVPYGDAGPEELVGGGVWVWKTSKLPPVVSAHARDMSLSTSSWSLTSSSTLLLFGGIERASNSSAESMNLGGSSSTSGSGRSPI